MIKPWEYRLDSTPSAFGGVAVTPRIEPAQSFFAVC